MIGSGTQALIDGGSLLRTEIVPVHCLIVEAGSALVLVDTGYGTRDITAPSGPMRFFRQVTRASSDLDETAAAQVRRLGYAPEDVTDIVLTHLHLDHAGGLPDFPQARVHVYAAERAGAQAPRSLTERMAYRPEHWAHGPNWVPYHAAAEDWFGLPATPPIGLGEAEFRLVPLPGHSVGHCAVALRMDDGWLLHCGDAYVDALQIDLSAPWQPPNTLPARAMTGIFPMIGAIYDHAPALRELRTRHGDRVQMFCAHDFDELTRYQKGS